MSLAEQQAKALYNDGWTPRQVNIILGKHRVYTQTLLREKPTVEAIASPLDLKARQRMYVLTALLDCQPIAPKWNTDAYQYLTILKFLEVPRDIAFNIYPAAPQREKSQAYLEKAPFLRNFNYQLLGVNSEEWYEFVVACYRIIKDKDRFR